MSDVIQYLKKNKAEVAKVLAPAVGVTVAAMAMGIDRCGAKPNKEGDDKPKE